MMLILCLQVQKRQHLKKDAMIIMKNFAYVSDFAKIALKGQKQMMKKPAAKKSMLTAKQKTLPKALQAKIMKAKKKGK